MSPIATGIGISSNVASPTAMSVPYSDNFFLVRYLSKFYRKCPPLTFIRGFWRYAYGLTATFLLKTNLSSSILIEENGCLCVRAFFLCTEYNFKIHIQGLPSRRVIIPPGSRLESVNVFLVWACLYVCDLVIKSVNCWLGEGWGGVLGQAERVMHNIYTVRKGGKIHANVDLR